MSIRGWRAVTVQALSEKIGPVADLLVEDVLAKQGVGEEGMNATTYLRFLELLYQELPHDVDRKALCIALRHQVLSLYGHSGAPGKH